MFARLVSLCLVTVLGLGALCAQPGSEMPKEEVQGQILDRVIGRVDDQIILKSDLDVSYLQVLQSGWAGSISDLRCGILEGLLINKMLLARAVTDSVYADENQVQQELDARFDEIIERSGGDVERIERAYGKSISDLKEELREQVRDQIVIEMMQNKITRGLEVTPAEVKEFFRSIPRDSLPFYSAEVVMGQIVVKAIPSNSEMERLKEELLDARRRIEGGQISFEEEARRISQDPGSARRGGELGFFGRGDLVPPYEAAAFNLEPGQISDPVVSEFGVHLIQLIERRGNRYNTRHILLTPNPSPADLARAERFVDSLRTMILDNKISFEQAAKTHSQDPRTAGSGGFFIDPQNGSPHVQAENIDVSLYRIKDTMKVGTISRPLPTEIGGKKAMRIIYFKESIPPHRADLAIDFPKMRRLALAQKRQTKLSEWFLDTRPQVFIQVAEDYTHCDLLNAPAP